MWFFQYHFTKVLFSFIVIYKKPFLKCTECNFLKSLQVLKHPWNGWKSKTMYTNKVTQDTAVTHKHTTTLPQSRSLANPATHSTPSKIINWPSLFFCCKRDWCGGMERGYSCSGCYREGLGEGQKFEVQQPDFAEVRFQIKWSIIWSFFEWGFY